MWIYLIGPAATPALLQSQAGIGFSPILSASMSPAANAGDLFLTKVVRASTLKFGDVITVRGQVTGTIYAHRIVEMRNADSVLRIPTKGEANPIIDQDPYIISPQGDLSKKSL